MKNLFSDTIANSRQRVYIKRQDDFDRLSQHAQSDAYILKLVIANWKDKFYHIVTIRDNLEDCRAEMD